MSLVEVHQIGRVASKPVTETLQLKDRTEARAVVTVISNARWKDGNGNVGEKATAITWTMWGRNALNASWYLEKGSRVAIAGTMESRRYADKAGKETFTYNFRVRSVDYLDSRAEAEARRMNAMESDNRAGEPASRPTRKSSRVPPMEKAV